MLVFEFCMLVVMCVRLNAIPFKVMDMLVVLVMFMFVFMLQRFVQMFMCMVLGQMKPNTKAHQRRSNPRYIYTLKELIHRHKICGRIVNANAHWNRAVSSSRDITAPARILPNKETLLKYGFGREGQNLSDEELQRRFLNWRLYRDLSGGPISDLGAHQIDIFN